MQSLDVRDGLAVPEAAAELGVSSKAVYRLISNGVIVSKHVAGRHVVPRSELRRMEHAPRPVGRPFAPHVSWQLIGMLAGLEPAGVSASRRSQLRRYIREAEPEDLAGRLRKRAHRELLYAHPSQLEQLRGDERMFLSGISVVDEIPGADLVVHDESELEAYVDPADLDGLVRDHVLARAVPAPNILLHVAKGHGDVLPQFDSAPSALVALDLIESADSRSSNAGWRLFNGLLEDAKLRV